MGSRSAPFSGSAAVALLASISRVVTARRMAEAGRGFIRKAVQHKTNIMKRGTSPSLIFFVAVALLLLASAAESFVVVPSYLSAGRSKLASASSSTPIGSDGAGKRIKMVDERMSATYDALASRLIDRHERDASRLTNGQLFVCVAGGPGSGKSTLSAAVAARINERMTTPSEHEGGGDGCVPAVVLPMDGFHYSRSQLRSMGESDSVEYTYEELLARRGAPWTFDAESCIAAFTEARTNGKASLPIYSREKSDPVPDGVRLHPETKIVLLEGNYLLAWDDGRWSPLRSNNVFDETWYITCKSLEEQRERLVRRHLETWSDEKTRMFGEGEVGAGAKADSNDMLNLVWIEEMSRKHADHLIESI